MRLAVGLLATWLASTGTASALDIQPQRVPTGAHFEFVRIQIGDAIVAVIDGDKRFFWRGKQVSAAEWCAQEQKNFQLTGIGFAVNRDFRLAGERVCP